jgi:hypothetical protein
VHPEKKIDVCDRMPSGGPPLRRPRPTQEQITRNLDIYFHGLRAHQQRGGK